VGAHLCWDPKSTLVPASCWWIHQFELPTSFLFVESESSTCWAAAHSSASSTFAANHLYSSSGSAGFPAKTNTTAAIWSSGDLKSTFTRKRQRPAPQQSSTTAQPAAIQPQKASTQPPHRSTGVSTRATTQRLQQQVERSNLKWRSPDGSLGLAVDSECNSKLRL
jgi:hypothetical protein